MKKVTLLTCLFTLLLAPITQAQTFSALQSRTKDLVERYAQLKEVQDRHTLLRAQAPLEDVLTKETNRVWEDGEWVNESETRYIYEGDTNTQVVTYQWDGTQWVESSRTVYEWNGDLIVSSTYELWENSAWVPQDRYFYEYDDGQQVNVVLYQVWENGEWVDTERSTTVLENGLIVSSQTDTTDGTNWFPVDLITFEEVEGDLVSTIQEWGGADWVNVGRTIYMDATLEEFYNSFLDLDADFLSSYGFAFFSLLPELISQEWENEEWVNLLRVVTEREFDGDELVRTLTSMESWEEGAWVASTEFDTEYETVGGRARPSKVTMNIPLGDDEWLTFLVSMLTYEGDNLVEIVNQVGDLFGGGGLVNSTQTLFEYDEVGSVDVEDDVLPQRYALDPAYPNPFNPSTNLTYKMSEPGHVTIRVYDALGRTVATLYSGVQAAGEHRVTFDAAGLPSGLYVVRMEAEGFQQARLATLIK